MSFIKARFDWSEGDYKCSQEFCFEYGAEVSDWAIMDHLRSVSVSAPSIAEIERHDYRLLCEVVTAAEFHGFDCIYQSEGSGIGPAW